MLQLPFNQEEDNQSRLIAKDFKNNNFDFLRLLFASAVFIHHAAFLTQNQQLNIIAFFIHPIIAIAVPGFFIISGFLIFMSYENSSSCKEYLIKRLRRLYPAYFFVVIACAIGLFFVSNFSPRRYFFNVIWFKYVIVNLCFLNSIQPNLPGAFANNTVNVVNGSLWTIKIEVMFYLLVPLLFYLLKRSRKKIILIIVIYLISYIYCESLTLMAKSSGHSFLLELARQLPGQLTYFISGAALYYYFDFFKRRALILLSFAIFLQIISSYLNVNFLYPACLAVFVLSFAFLTPYINFFRKNGDFSYGIYIFHFPIIQVFIQYKVFETVNPYLAIILLIITVALASIFSWRFIEKPFLKRRNNRR